MESHPGGPEQYMKELKEVIDADRGEGGSKRIIAVGEMGLGQSLLSSKIFQLIVETMTASTFPPKTCSSNTSPPSSAFRKSTGSLCSCTADTLTRTATLCGHWTK